MSRRWKALSAVAAVALLAVVPIQFATGQAPLTLEPQDAGYIRLQMDSQGSRFRQFNPDHSLNASQTFKATSCKYSPVSPPSGFNVVGLSASNPSAVGYLTSGSGKYGLGVNTNEGTGKCTQINAPNEKLTLNLQNGPGEALEGLYVDYMELDIEAKFNASITIELYRDGSPVGEPFVESCTTSGSDCGPDSSDGDNFRIRVPRTGAVLFDEMRLYSSGSSGSAVTLEAGADGTNYYGFNDPAVTGLGESLGGTKDSVFHLVTLGEGVLTCTNGTNIATEGAAVTLTRRSFPNDPTRNPDGSPCIPINYELTRNGNEVEFLKDPTQDPNGSFDIRVDAWDPEDAQNPVPPSTVYPPDPDGELIVWCDGTAAAPVMPAGDHFWCLFAQSTQIVAGGPPQQMQVTEGVLLEGDARITRG
jgi:hypothetical protein